MLWPRDQEYQGILVQHRCRGIKWWNSCALKIFLQKWSSSAMFLINRDFGTFIFAGVLGAVGVWRWQNLLWLSILSPALHTSLPLLLKERWFPSQHTRSYPALVSTDSTRPSWWGSSPLSLGCLAAGMDVPPRSSAQDFPGPTRLLMELAPTQSWGWAAVLAQEAAVPGEAASHGT